MAMAPTNDSHITDTGDSALIPHLFRTEYGRIVAVLCKHFGMRQMAMAEDIAADTFMAACETWPYNGIPREPVAWLYTVAKNKAKNTLQRNATKKRIETGLPQDTTIATEEDIDLTETNITDSQLQMMFALCHGGIAAEAQVAMALRILCGFGIDEIATAFLTTKDVINKRLYRAKEKMRQDGTALSMPPEKDLPQRLEPILATIYLLFSEGYYSESDDEIIRRDLCTEAMRLCHMLLQHPDTKLAKTNALMALMCLQASRFAARSEGYVLYDEQDDALWDRELIARGCHYLHAAAQGNTISTYHYEAMIAWWHTQKEKTTEKWRNILALYTGLLALTDNPVARLNRIYALWQVHGNTAALAAMNDDTLPHNQYYYILFAQLHTGNAAIAADSYRKALQLTRSTTEAKHITRLIHRLSPDLGL